MRKADKHHLAGKPTELMRQLVQICESGGRVLDPLAGSGTTRVAVEGYPWTGIEMTSNYLQVTSTRLGLS